MVTISVPLPSTRRSKATTPVDASPSAKATKKTRTIPPSSPYLVCSEKDDSPLRPIFCLKKLTDLTRYEKTEDCFILDFDLSDSFSTAKLSSVADDDLSVIAQKGKVACRDYPHSRHLCGEFPFSTTKHETFCPMCYCYVCDSAAPCKDWTNPVTGHCHATENNGSWKQMRKLKKRQKGR